MLGRKIVETQQAFAVLDQAFNGLVVFYAVGIDEEIKRFFGLDPCPTRRRPCPR